MSKEKWIEEAYKLLCKSLGEPANETEKANLLEWAQAYHENYSAEGMTPQEAHDEEMSSF